VPSPEGIFNLLDEFFLKYEWKIKEKPLKNIENINNILNNIQNGIDIC